MLFLSLALHTLSGAVFPRAMLTARKKERRNDSINTADNLRGAYLARISHAPRTREIFLCVLLLLLLRSCNYRLHIPVRAARTIEAELFGSSCELRVVRYIYVRVEMYNIPTFRPVSALRAVGKRDFLGKGGVRGAHARATWKKRLFNFGGRVPRARWCTRPAAFHFWTRRSLARVHKILRFIVE